MRAMLAEEKRLENIHALGAIVIQYHADIPRLEHHERGDWIDMYAAETVDMKAGEYRRISLGVSMWLPEGYEAHILPRSSTFEKWGILCTNSEGIVDSNYNGANDVWQFPALAMRDTHIEKGDRICQFRIIPVMQEITFYEADKLLGKDRGGFGSTGTR